MQGYGYGSFNIGTGHGYSVYEVIKMIEHIAKQKFIVQYEQRRAGDPPILVADSTHAQSMLGWRPTESDLYTIVHTAHDFYTYYVLKKYHASFELNDTTYLKS